MEWLRSPPLGALLAWWLAQPLWTEAFDPAAGLKLAYLEKAVYCGREKFEAWDVGDSLLFGPRAVPAGTRYVSSFPTNAAAGVVRAQDYEGPYCAVGMRGSDGKRSDLMDAMFWMVDFERGSCAGCEVDFGFYENYKSLKKGIFEALDDLGCHGYTLDLVGHSLGAAGTTYLLYDALDAGFKVRRAYALESPRPGNAAFATALGKLIEAKDVDAHRVTHFKDMVPHLPPMKLFYRHALPEIYYPTEKGTEYLECDREDKLCSNQWEEPWQMAPSDHTWFLNINPCWCQNDTRRTVGDLAAWRGRIPEKCWEVFDVMAEDMTCGWHIHVLVASGKGRRAAAQHVARRFPRKCGPCASAKLGLAQLGMLLGIVALAVGLLAMLRAGGRRRRVTRLRPEYKAFGDEGGAEETSEVE